MNKQTENTTQTSPPTDESANSDELVQPPAAAGGTDTTDNADLAQLRAENEQLKATIRLTEAHRQITGELGRIGARSPELLFEAVKADLQFADDGKLQNAAALVGELKTLFPEQFGTHTPAGIDAGAGRQQPPALTRDALAKMKPAEIAALDWGEVRRVLAAS